MPRSRSKLTVDCVLPAFASAAIALVVPTAYSLLFARGTYAGVQDESVSASIAERYSPYLTAVAGSMAGVALTELALLFVVLLGLSLPWRLRARRTPSARTIWAVHVVAGFFVTCTYFLFVADRYPGLFLSTLSRWSLAYPLLAVARYVAPAIAVASACGYAYGLVRGPMRVRVGVGVMALIVAGGFFARHRLAQRYVHKPYRMVVDSKTPPPEPPKPGKKRVAAAKPSILWISVDSLRPDKIDDEHTPNIAKVVRQSLYFPNTLVTVPRTGPSWVATLTSLSPLTNGVETMFPDARAGRLSYVAMPAHLAARGHRTAVFSDYSGEFFWKVDLGFQLRSVPEVELREISGQILLGNAPLVLAQAGVIYSLGKCERSILRDPLTTLIRGLTSFTDPQVLADDLEAWLAQDTKAPFFALVFYSQPHFPYASSYPYYRKYHVPGSSPSIAFGRDVANETPITSPEDIRQIDALYRGALAESDAAIGRLLAHLEASGDLDDTILVLTADHGEGLYECPTCIGHGDNLRSMYTLRTPLAIRLPKSRYPDASEPRVVETYVSQLDIYPTLLALLGERAVAVHEGVALLDSRGVLGQLRPDRVHFAETGEWLWTTPAVPKDRIEYPPITGMATLERGRIVIDPKHLPAIRAAKHRVAIRWPYKLLYAPRKSGVEWRLYKADEDLLDERDVSAVEPKIFEELKQALRFEVLRHANMMSVRDYFVSRPPPPIEE